MTDEQHAQPRCQEDAAVDAVTLQCARSVDDYVLNVDPRAFAWDEAVVRCADDGFELMLGSGEYDAGTWSGYMCADLTGVRLPDTAAAAPDDGIMPLVIWVVFFMALAFAHRRTGR